MTPLLRGAIYQSQMTQTFLESKSSNHHVRIPDITPKSQSCRWRFCWRIVEETTTGKLDVLARLDRSAFVER